MSQTPGLWLIAGLCVSGPALADLALVQEKQCMQCHAVSQDLIGPSFKRIAYRWKGNPAAEKMLLATIQNGTLEGAGQHWSERTKMPDAAERPRISDAQAQEILAWIMRQ